ncbi:Transcription factor TCP4-like [Castilleja foliolosa]|uniref:Transcription factor TCP4-like n=1 Tax=Castilleja foliolosa TaxID=1961234 RepID=A0ABD3BB38_9LAMI
MNHFKALVCILDRLGCDWPSKVVDWLISKAKTTMDALAELPAWNPNASTPSAAAAAFDPESSHRSLEQENQQQNNMLSDISADSPDVWVSRVIIPNGLDTGSVLLEKWVNTGGRPLGIAHGLYSELILADADKQASDELGVFLLNRLNAQKKKGYESVYDRSNLSKWCTSSYLIMKLYLMKILGFSALVNLVFCSENSGSDVEPLGQVVLTSSFHELLDPTCGSGFGVVVWKIELGKFGCTSSVEAMHRDYAKDRTSSRTFVRAKPQHDAPQRYLVSAPRLAPWPRRPRAALPRLAPLVLPLGQVDLAPRHFVLPTSSRSLAKTTPCRATSSRTPRPAPRPKRRYLVSATSRRPLPKSTPLDDATSQHLV